ncbi:hypothetical protein SHIRM173S_02074 [Streptomyces hirsutus]
MPAGADAVGDQGDQASAVGLQQCAQAATRRRESSGGCGRSVSQPAHGDRPEDAVLGHGSGELRSIGVQLDEPVLAHEGEVEVRFLGGLDHRHDHAGGRRPLGGGLLVHRGPYGGGTGTAQRRRALPNSRRPGSIRGGRGASTRAVASPAPVSRGSAPGSHSAMSAARPPGSGDYGPVPTADRPPARPDRPGPEPRIADRAPEGAPWPPGRPRAGVRPARRCRALRPVRPPRSSAAPARPPDAPRHAPESEWNTAFVIVSRSSGPNWAVSLRRTALINWSGETGGPRRSALCTPSGRPRPGRGPSFGDVRAEDVVQTLSLGGL